MGVAVLEALAEEVALDEDAEEAAEVEAAPDEDGDTPPVFVGPELLPLGVGDAVLGVGSTAPSVSLSRPATRVTA